MGLPRGKVFGPSRVIFDVKAFVTLVALASLPGCAVYTASRPVAYAPDLYYVPPPPPVGYVAPVPYSVPPSAIVYAPRVVIRVPRYHGHGSRVVLAPHRFVTVPRGRVAYGPRGHGWGRRF